MSDRIISSDRAVTRRRFCAHVAGAAAGMMVGARVLGEDASVLGAQAGPGAGRRAATLDGRRITVIDVHAHVFVPEVWDLVKDTPLASAARNSLTGAIAL